MNYHIMIDDKFIDGFIDDAEKVSLPNSNIYFIRGNINDRLHVTHSLARWVDISSIDFMTTLNSIKVNDKIFVHWYDLQVSKLLLLINKEIRLYVPLWGGDFYQEPYLYHIDWIHDPLTLSFVKRKYLFPKKWSLKPWVFIGQIRTIYEFKKKSVPEFEIKKQTIERINYILIDPNNIAEIDLTKKIYKLNDLCSLPFNYNLNFDVANSIRTKKTDKKSNLNILIGNSGTEANNHADCFRVLKKFKKQQIALSVPLSYGSADYIAFVKEKGVQQYKEKFVPLEKFMAREEYIMILNKIDIGIMYHNRSQAFGNMITLLSLGKKLYLKNNNPLWKLFVKIGVKVFDANVISHLSFEEFSMAISSSEKQQNIEIISTLFSDKKRLEYVRNVLN